MKFVKTGIATIIAAMCIAPFAAMAHPASLHANAALGSSAPAQAATRTIVISGDSKSISVNNGDIVTISVDGQAFTWSFDTLRDSDRFASADIAPEGINTHGIWVYVAPNPLYTR
jgi:hypothetical protein